MSWNIDKTGKLEEVKEAVTADAHMPQPLKDAIGLFLDAGKDSPMTSPIVGARVKTGGHYDKGSAGSNIYYLSIEKLTELPPK